MGSFYYVNINLEPVMGRIANEPPSNHRWELRFLAPRQSETSEEQFPSLQNSTAKNSTIWKDVFNLKGKNSQDKGIAEPHSNSSLMSYPISLRGLCVQGN